MSVFDLSAWCDECKVLWYLDPDKDRAVVGGMAPHEPCGQMSKVKGFRMSMSFGARSVLEGVATTPQDLAECVEEVGDE